MGRAPCCEKVGLKRGRWTAEEDEILMKYIQDNGEGSWRSLPKNAGLLRCGKSCRLRWLNYLRNDLKRGNISPEEEKLIIKLHSSLGNRWSLIAGHLPGRTDNEIKNYWNSHLSRRIDTFRRPSEEPLPIIMNLANLNGGGKKKGGRTSRSTMKKKIPYNKYTHHSNLVKMTNIGETLEKVDCLDGPVLTNASANQEKLMDLTYQVELNEEMGNMTNDPFLERENSVVLCTNEERESEMLGPIQGLETELMCPSNTVASEVVDPSGLLTFTNNAESGFMGFNEERESGFMGFNVERESGVSNMKAINEGGDLMNTTSLVDEISEWYSLDSNSINSSFDDHEWFDWDLIGILDNHHHNPWESGEQILSWLED